MVPAMGFRHIFRYSAVDASATDDTLMQGNALKIKKDLNHRFIVDQFNKLALQGVGFRQLVDWTHRRMNVSYHFCVISIFFKDVMNKSAANAGGLGGNPTSGFESVGSALFLTPMDAKTGINALLYKGF